MEVADPIHCAGRPDELGRAQGEGWRDLIRRSLALPGELEGFRVAKPALLPFRLFRWLAERRSAGFWRRELGVAEPDMASWLSGIAGGGVPCPWDLNADGSVGILDLLSLLTAWGTDPGGPPDFDGDGNVGILDLLALLTNWGPCP